MNSMVRKMALLAILVWAGTATAQISQPTPFIFAGLRLEVDRRELSVGETLTLTLEFKQMAAGQHVEGREPAIHTPTHFEINMKFSNSHIEMVDQETQVINTTKFKLTATQTGEETFGPYRLTYTDAKGEKREAESNIVTVKVVEKKPFLGRAKKKEEAPAPAAAPAQDDLRDLKPLLGETHWVFWTFFWIVLLAALGGFAWRIWSRRKPAPVKAAPAPEEAVRLKEAWRKLGKEDLESRLFCLGLSTLVRECLQHKFSFPAVDFTTGEILKELKIRKAGADEMEAVEKCLRACDRVLYADGNLTGRDALRSAAQVFLPKTQKN